MGRPQVATEEKRSVKITFRLTKEEKKKLEQSAEICGFATGIFIREKLFKGRFPEPKVAKVDVGIYLELKKIGVNINQIAKHVNSGMVPIGILAVLNKLMEQQQTIIRILIDDSRSGNR